MIALLQILTRRIVPYRKRIIALFQIAEVVVVLFAAMGAYYIYNGSPSAGIWYGMGAKAGTLALYVFFLTITPGILRRFRLLLPIQQLMMLFRRHLGILTYLLGVMHWVLVRLVFAARQNTLTATPPSYELASFIALQIMFLLFVTSNDWSVKRMGVWWKRLHTLIYVVAWLLFYHVAFQPGEAQEKAPLALFMAIAELASLAVDWRRNRLARIAAQEAVLIDETNDPNLVQ